MQYVDRAVAVTGVKQNEQRGGKQTFLDEGY